jgi:hypothetical protein
MPKTPIFLLSGESNMADSTLPVTPPKSRSLFHYTTAEGLLGIVRDRALFATHADFANDSSECRVILPYLTKILENEFSQIVPKLIKLKAMSHGILIDYGNSLYEEEARNCVRTMLRAANNTTPYFITSFCVHDKKDHAYSHGLLSQWRGYAVGGFAIEFDELSIDELNKEEHAGWQYSGILTNVVEYENHEDRVRSADFKGMAGAFLRTILQKELVSAMLSGKRKELDDILGNAPMGRFTRPFLSVAPFLKHIGFSEESEYRILALCNRPTKSEPGDKRKIKKFNFKSRRDGNVVPYIAMYAGLGKPLPIKGIIIGPHAQQENQRTAVELLLEQHDIKAEVRVSATPFR